MRNAESKPIEPAAREYSLGFLPVRDEQFDFMVPKVRRERAAVVAFRGLLVEAETRERLEEMGFSGKHESPPIATGGLHQVRSAHPMRGNSGFTLPSVTATVTRRSSV